MAARQIDGGAPTGGERPGVGVAKGGSGEGVPEFDGQYRIKLESFEGPLDLLLHLIQQHELDILDIPVSFITAKYLEYLKLMQVLSIEIASEYLVMAATLVHIKSKMLLPAPPPGQDDGMPAEEEEDPRAELVRRLLEYQKYKAAAAELAERGTLGRDVFPRGVEEADAPGPAPFATVEVFGLLEAFEKLLKKSKVKIDHEVVFDRISITDRIVELTEKLEGRRAVRFEWLFLSSRGGPPTRFDLVITFLAMLEMCRMKLLRVYQTGPLAPIYMGLVDEVAELSEEDQAIADSEAKTVLAAEPELEEPVIEEPSAVVEEPSALIEEPADVVEEPSAVIEEPSAIIEELADVVEEPSAVVEEPSAVVEEPSALVEEPSAVVEEPTAVVEEPSALIEEPTEVVEEPSAVVEEPSALIEEPTEVVEEPSAVVEEPSAMIEEPSAVVQEPPSDREESSAAPEEPSLGDVRLALDTDTEPRASASSSSPRASASGPPSSRERLAPALAVEAVSTAEAPAFAPEALASTPEAPASALDGGSPAEEPTPPDEVSDDG